MRTRQRWTAVQTHGGAERVAEAHAERQGFETYLPRFQIKRSRDGEIIHSARILFPGYLFVRFATRWQSLLGTRGVASVLLGTDGPARVADADIARLRALENERGYVVLPEPVVEKMRRGCRIVVERGVVSLFGFFERQVGNDAIVRLDRAVLGSRSTRVPVDAVRAV